MKDKFQIKEVENSFVELTKQVALIIKAIRKNPSKQKQILMRYVSHFYEAVKETVKKQGSIIPYYIILADTPDFGAFVTDDVISKAKEIGAEAVISVEGFQSDDDVGDVIYHVSMSAPCMGVLGWVFKVKHADSTVNIIREMPYLFDSQNKVRTLRELVMEMEREASHGPTG